ncbi:hypothetical protein GCM10020358_22040 [Amorphoplanes nipponensis]
MRRGAGVEQDAAHRRQGVRGPVPAPARGDQPGAPEGAQVLGDRRGAHAEMAGECRGPRPVGADSGVVKSNA